MTTTQEAIDASAARLTDSYNKMWKALGAGDTLPFEARLHFPKSADGLQDTAAEEFETDFMRLLMLSKPNTLRTNTKVGVFVGFITKKPPTDKLEFHIPAYDVPSKFQAGLVVWMDMTNDKTPIVEVVLEQQNTMRSATVDAKKWHHIILHQNVAPSTAVVIANPSSTTFLSHKDVFVTSTATLKPDERTALFQKYLSINRDLQ